MANNRIALVCTYCPAGSRHSRFPLFKYYPSQGWYINREADRLAMFGPDVNAWLDQHRHGVPPDPISGTGLDKWAQRMFGTFIEVEYEHDDSVDP